MTKRLPFTYSVYSKGRLLVTHCQREDSAPTFPFSVPKLLEAGFSNCYHFSWGKIFKWPCGLLYAGDWFHFVGAQVSSFLLTINIFEKNACNVLSSISRIVEFLLLFLKISNIFLIFFFSSLITSISVLWHFWLYQVFSSMSVQVILFNSISLLLYLFVVKSLSHVQLFTTAWTGARQTTLSITISQSLFRLRSFESVVPSNYLILCCPLLLLLSIFPSIRVFPLSQLLASGG